MVERAQQELPPLLHFVVCILGYHETYPFRIVVTDEFLEGRDVVLLAPETQHEDRTGVRMVHQRGEEPLRALPVSAQLGAPEGVGKGVYPVDGAELPARAGPLGEALGQTVHAPHGRDDPDLVPGSRPPVGAEIPPERRRPRGVEPNRRNRFVDIVELAREPRFEVVDVNPFAGPDVSDGGPYGSAVLRHRRADGQVLQRDLVGPGNLFEGGDFGAAGGAPGTCGDRLGRHRHVVPLVYPDELQCHFITRYAVRPEEVNAGR